MARPGTPGSRWLGPVCLAAGMLVLLGLGGCRRGVPVIDTAPKPVQRDGTISGSIRGPEGTSPVEGRVVEAVNLASGERYRETTSSTGGYTFKLKPGKYRVEVTLREGESVIKQPGVIDLNQSDVDAHADFVVGIVRISHPRYPANRADSSLGSPVA